jgi:phosphoribosylanthranilate isomerase
MSFKYQTKINHTKHLTDARFAAAAGVNYLGFCFDNESGSFIHPIKAKEIIDWTSGSHIVAEFGKQSAEDINTIVQLLNIDIVELTSVMDNHTFNQIQVPVILKMNVQDYNSDALIEFCKNYGSLVQAFHFNHWEALAAKDPTIFTSIEKEYFLQINGDFANQLPVLEQIKPFGISFEGDSEEKAGVRDFELLSDFLEQLRIEE